MEPDVLIVGAGAAGLACGRRLFECGVTFQILDASDRVGGRLNTLFPALLTAGPETQRLLDTTTLELNPFASRPLIRVDRQFRSLESLLTPVASRRDVLRLWRFASEPRHDPAEAEERLALDLLRWNGRFTPAMIDRFFRPLAGWLFHDRSLATSSRLFRHVIRMLLEGPVAVPARGMPAIAEQLETLLPAGAVSRNTCVERIGEHEVVLASGAVRAARAVVDAAGLNEPGGLRAATLIYAVDQPPFEMPCFVFSGDGSGPVNHLAMLPDGKHLAVGVVGEPEDIETRVRVSLAEWFGAAASRWELVSNTRSELPAMTAGRCEPWQRDLQVQTGHFVCGWHTDGATLDGAFSSGFRAAQAAMAHIHAERAG